MLQAAIWINVGVIFAMFAMLIYALFQAPSRVQLALTLLTICTMVTLIGYVMEICARNVEGAIAGTMTSYIGKPFAVFSLYLFVCEFCKKEWKKNWLAITLAAFSTFFTFIVLSNNRHHMFYTSVGYDRSKIFSPLVLGHGVFYYLYMAYFGIVFVICSIYIIQEYRKSTTKTTKKQAGLLLAIPITVAIGYILFIAKVTSGYDTALLGSALSVGFVYALFFKYRLFDYLLYAKDKALDDSTDAIIVFNEHNSVLYKNTAMTTLFGDETFSSKELIEVEEGEKNVFKGEEVYRVNKSGIENGGQNFGCVIEISNITTQFNYVLRLRKEVEAKTHEIRDIQKGIITSFAGLVEARDDSTGTHVKRMARYVDCIANSLHKNGDYLNILNRDYISMLVEVSPLHDVGKISISDTILLKPGRLTPEEFDVMKTHTTRGDEIIQNCFKGLESEEYINIASDVAHYHHEKWDGSGYPKGLKGEEIPLCARIVAVADVYDALCSKRCYKDAIPQEAAVSIILEEKGKQFDPVVVDAFVRALTQIKKVKG